MLPQKKFDYCTICFFVNFQMVSSLGLITSCCLGMSPSERREEKKTGLERASEIEWKSSLCDGVVRLKTGMSTIAPHFLINKIKRNKFPGMALVKVDKKTPERCQKNTPVLKNLAQFPWYSTV